MCLDFAQFSSIKTFKYIINNNETIDAPSSRFTSIIILRSDPPPTAARSEDLTHAGRNAPRRHQSAPQTEPEFDGWFSPRLGSLGARRLLQNIEESCLFEDCKYICSRRSGRNMILPATSPTIKSSGCSFGKAYTPMYLIYIYTKKG